MLVLCAAQPVLWATSINPTCYQSKLVAAVVYCCGHMSPSARKQKRINVIVPYSLTVAPTTPKVAPGVFKSHQ